MKKIAIIGGGFYGCNLAIDLKNLEKKYKVVIFDKNNEILQGAISNNQHRLHLGYHYPRCDFTIKQAIKTYGSFINNYEDCLFEPEKNFYFINKNGYVKFDDFVKKFSNYGLKFDLASKSQIKKYITNPEFIDGGVICNEKVILLDKLKAKILKNISNQKIEIRTNTAIKEIQNNVVFFDKSYENFDYVINTTYSQPHVGFKGKIRTKSELCFIPIFKDKRGKFKKDCVTIMDGDFASVYQTGKKNLLSLSNVRLTPYYKNENMEELIKVKNSLTKNDIKNISFEIVEDSKKWLLNLEDLEFIDCYVSIKTKVLQDKNDYRGSYFLSENNCSTIMCGKISAYYDIRDSLILKIMESV